jgi:ribosomal protein L11 methyltransferase
MKDATIQIDIIAADDTLKETLIAKLATIGFEAFEEMPEILKAFIPFDLYDQAALISVLGDLQFQEMIIEKQNWNELWESNFEPVQVEDFVGIRASFHQEIKGVEHEIVITPKMSFGTGHHATTYLVMQAMRNLSFKNKTIFDFGTGTGILAILAEKLGAKQIRAIDNDDWCIENATENIAINHCQRIQIEKADTAEMQDKYEIILANINKHIILANIPFLAQILQKEGTILLSGLLVEDEEDILKACESVGWKFQFTQTKNGWIVCQFKSQS